MRAIWNEVCHLASMPAVAWDEPGFDYTLYFTVKCVAPGGAKCWSCHWISFCNGCHIAPDASLVNWEHFESPADPVQFAIDWTPDAIAKFFDGRPLAQAVLDPSVERCAQEALRPTHILDCMQQFTKVRLYRESASAVERAR